MKNFLKNMIATVFIITMVILPFVGSAAAESGNFTKAIVIIAIEIIGCAVTFGIASYNEKIKQKEKMKENFARERVIKKKAAKKAAKKKAYQDATMKFVTSYDI